MISYLKSVKRIVQSVCWKFFTVMFDLMKKFRKIEELRNECKLKIEEFKNSKDGKLLLSCNPREYLLKIDRIKNRYQHRINLKFNKRPKIVYGYNTLK